MNSLDAAAVSAASSVGSAAQGYAGGMTEPSPAPAPSLAATASESTEESLRHEREAVGDQPDTGGLVTPDHAQSAPAGQDQQ